ncbi:MAG TPA: hypothetical protein VG754_13955 [Verrucomicrobiae bacterium]|jgi:hypothetical protein|nr:hypothetical protein [Verrucomicrobiae bacterium]
MSAPTLIALGGDVYTEVLRHMATEDRAALHAMARDFHLTMRSLHNKSFNEMGKSSFF